MTSTCGAAQNFAGQTGLANARCADQHNCGQAVRGHDLLNTGELILTTDERPPKRHRCKFSPPVLRRFAHLPSIVADPSRASGLGPGRVRPSEI